MILIGLVIFIGSALLFVIQPFAARLFLPAAGGSPAIWNTCMLFFQMLLLSGYALTHILTGYLSMKRQIIVFCLLAFIPLFLLPPIAPASGPPAGENPTIWLIVFLAASVGIPFLILSMSAPILQKWLAASKLSGASDPYFLYSASNMGSLIGLLGYPFIVEPFSGLSDQGRYFKIAYICYCVGIFLAGFLCAKYSASDSETSKAGSLLARQEPASADMFESHTSGIKCRKALGWVLLAFIPSSLTLGVTHHLSSEIAAIPLLWAVPLAVYLTTFIIAFSSKLLQTALKVAANYGIIVPILLFAFLRQSNEPIILVILIHLSALFLGALLCHTLLASSRPDPAHLTIFYLLVAVGGALGGIFNALIAPICFDSIMEYPLVLSITCFLLPQDKPWNRYTKIGLPIILLFWMIGVRLILGDRDCYDILSLIFRDVIPPAFAYFVSGNSTVYALSALIISIFACVFPSSYGMTLHAERTFFGVHRVTLSSDGNFRQLVHGTTIHGLQKITSLEKPAPTSYFHPTGPIGQVFSALRARSGSDGYIAKTGIIGLGAGSIAAYGESGEEMVFFEIDPAVIRIARNPEYFTFLKNSCAEINLVIGDGRKSLTEEPHASYDLLILDAFSSDSVPMHLLTCEAFNIYLDRLKSGGIIALHISNRYLSMEPVVTATLTNMGLTVFSQEDHNISESEASEGKSTSTWVVAAADIASVGDIRHDPRWIRAKNDRSGPNWSDDRATLLDMLGGFH